LVERDGQAENDGGRDKLERVKLSFYRKTLLTYL
jgi:hypothetical protein